MTPLDPSARRGASSFDVWRTMVNGLRGQPLPLPGNLMDDAERRVGARFPDLWLARVMERSWAAFGVGLALALAFVSLGVYNGWRLCASAPVRLVHPRGGRRHLRRARPKSRL